uniref:DUF4283 domain-containing protein n=1 Tax=Cannabis sativa TaxID=3483 RepID=A0A803PIE0_CANSA
MEEILGVGEPDVTDEESGEEEGDRTEMEETLVAAADRLQPEEVPDFSSYLEATMRMETYIISGNISKPPILRSEKLIQNLSGKFENADNRGKVNSGVKLEIEDIEDNRQWKPVVMEPWDPNTYFTKENIESVPTWIQIPGLNLKYWGEKLLFKIVGQLGKPIMTNKVTKNKERLNYPRILIEVQINQEFPEIISFTNELDQEVEVFVKYERIPNICGNCEGMGHTTEVCRKKEEQKKAWVVKEK